MRGRRDIAVPGGRAWRAFTLVELLVVVAIIALLLALLAPILNTAVEMARQIKCATNLKDVGTAVQIFAGGHGGRAPSHAIRSDGGYVGFFGELAGFNVLTEKVSKSYYQNGYMACPSYKESQNNVYWFQTFEINAEVAADHYHGPEGHVLNGQPYVDPGTGIGQGGTHGLLLPGPPEGYIFYAVGRKLLSFSSPGRKFMIWECHNSAGDEMFGPRYEYRNQNVPLYPPGQFYPPWVSDPYGTYSFRHMLPPDPAQYPTQAVANFLFVDAHVEPLCPNDHVNYDDRFVFDN